MLLGLVEKEALDDESQPRTQRLPSICFIFVKRERSRAERVVGELVRARSTPAGLTILVIRIGARETFEEAASQFVVAAIDSFFDGECLVFVRFFDAAFLYDPIQLPVELFRVPSRGFSTECQRWVTSQDLVFPWMV
ncbi:MAG: hypothetical protein M2R45_00414 [Verrucomicrobia subdivision 3 bacterium]|nr:hypothetical protein [Limisphaerales bacterium]MCS1413707.1 hypothetical protein [Limisphaerales bacterium]